VSQSSSTIQLDGQSLTLADVVAVARLGARPRLAEHARLEMGRSHDWVMRAASGDLRDATGAPLPVYGVNTGYGSLARKRIELSDIRALSSNLIRSHAAGVGPEVDSEVVRAMMLLRANALAKGASGCRPLLVDTLCAMLEAGVIPAVPSQGSCGSSGDLAPLAHLGLVLFDGPEEASGHARLGGERMTGKAAMEQAGIERLSPGPKEGLAVTNGAQLTCAITALACHDADALVHDAEIAAALSWEALRGVTRALHPAVHQLRPFPGAIASAASLRRMLSGSSLVDSDADKVQDAYSLRCAPIVLGAVRDALEYVRSQVLVELNAVTDNPVILVDTEPANKAYSAGLFHGEPIGFAADHLKLAMSELAALSERRTYRLTTSSLSAMVASLPDVMPQTTAAALVATCRQLSLPASADSIPTCEDQEDFVAMSTTAARRASEVLVHARRVVAIETVVAARSLQRIRQAAPDTVFGPAAAAVLPLMEGAEARVPADLIDFVDTQLRNRTFAHALERRAP